MKAINCEQYLEWICDCFSWLLASLVYVFDSSVTCKCKSRGCAEGDDDYDDEGFYDVNSWCPIRSLYLCIVSWKELRKMKIREKTAERTDSCWTRL